MTKKDTMAKLPGLHSRDGIYYLRVMVPKDLQKAYGRTKLVESLGTGESKTAKVVGTALRATRLNEFEQKRRALSPQKLDKVSPELAATLARRVTAHLLTVDERLRTDPASAQLLMRSVRAAVPSTLTIGDAPLPEWLTAPTNPLHGLAKELAADLAKINQQLDADAALYMATQRVSYVLPMVQAQARQLGFEFDAKTPGAIEALRECLKSHRKARHDITRRDRGEIIETPEPELTAAERPMKLREVYARWKASKRRSPDADAACERALVLYEKQSGNPPVQKITREQGDAFRAWLLTQGTSSKTSRDRLGWVKSLLKYAYRELELIPRQPWEGLDIEHHTENPRKPWSDEQLAAFFSLPLFTEKKLPRAWKAGGEAAYWIPLLGLYTGARIGELAQLRVADIEKHKDGAWIRISEEAEGSKVKTEAGLRLVPVHSELVRLGFLDYVENLKGAKEVALWPVLAQRRGKPGGYFSAWFATARKTVTDLAVPDFHSFRHTVRTALVEAEVDGDVIDRVVGHETRGTGKRYNHARAILRQAIEKLRFPVPL